MEDLSTPLLDIVNEKLLNPEMSCGQPGVVVSTPLITGGSSSTLLPSEHSSSSSAFGGSSALPNNLVSDDVSASGQPILLFCGRRQDSQNIVNAETLVLSFAYELHRPVEGVSEQAAIRALKKAMLKSIAEKLQCTGDSNLVRSLRTTNNTHQQIVAVESSLHDTPNNKSPCTIPINHAVPTICHSMIGSMKAYFAQRTPSQTLTDARDELLFFIRTTMSSGAYESAEVRKVIYIEDLSVGVVHSNPPPNAQQVLVWQENDNEGDFSSLLTGFVVALSVILVGLLGFLFMSRRRSRGRGIMLQQFQPSVIEDIVRDVEEDNNDADLESIWQESIWQRALNAYDNGDAKVAATDTYTPMMNEDSASVDPVGFRFEPHTSLGGESKAAVSESEEAAPMPVSVESGSIGENETETKSKEPIDVDDKGKGSRTITSVGVGNDKEMDSEGKELQLQDQDDIS